jgi:hypothetical protein
MAVVVDTERKLDTQYNACGGDFSKMHVMGEANDHRRAYYAHVVGTACAAHSTAACTQASRARTTAGIFIDASHITGFSR